MLNGVVSWDNQSRLAAGPLCFLVRHQALVGDERCDAIAAAGLALGLLLRRLRTLVRRRSRQGNRAPVSTAATPRRVIREWIKTSQYVAVRDGTRLAVDIYRPAIDGRAVEGTISRRVGAHAVSARVRGCRRARSEMRSKATDLSELIRHGYVVAAVDTRGRGASFGARRGFQDRTEANDAYDMTEWFAKQPFSTGAIGVAGCSYLGGTTWHSATTLAPHLRAIAPGCTDFDKYGFVSRGGITAQFNTRPEDPAQDFGQGVLPVDEDTDGKLAAQAIAGHAAGTPMAELWRGMPYRDDVSPLARSAVLARSERRDLLEADRALQRRPSSSGATGSTKAASRPTLAFNNLRNPRKLWMGVWPHCQVGDFPMATELLRFFDHYLQDVDNGWDREPPIYYRTVNARPDRNGAPRTNGR